MFENVIGQGVIARISSDLEGGVFPSSVLFSGPEASAKGTAALELARILSCESTPDFNRSRRALWSCLCPSCALHRTLSHPDLVALGPRQFQVEIAASLAVFLKETGNAAARMLFFRAVRKLLLRFSPVLWEGDSKTSKLNKPLETIDDHLEEIMRMELRAELDEKERQKLEKTCGKIAAECAALETEGASGIIPVSLVRRASYWLRTAPCGNRKTLIIENADRMNDAARNSLLKILEEPPESACIILTSAKSKTLLPTILSRLRPYSFVQRSAEDEIAVVKRIFRGESAIPSYKTDGEEETDELKKSNVPNMPHECYKLKETPLRAFLNVFLPASGGSLFPVAAYFWSSLAAGAIVLARKRGGADNATLAALGAHCAPIAEYAGFPRHDTAIKTMTAVIMKAAVNFEPRTLFSLFLGLLYNAFGDALRGENNADTIRCRMFITQYGEEARQAVEVYNQHPSLALERLAETLRSALSGLGGTGY